MDDWRPACEQGLEDTERVLRLCCTLKTLWQELRISKDLDWDSELCFQAWELCFQAWLKKGCPAKSHSNFSDIPWGTLFAFACWDL